MKKIIMKKIVASIVGLTVAGALSAAKKPIRSMVG